MESNHLEIRVNKDTVLGTVGVKKGDSVYNTVSLYFDEVLPKALKSIEPKRYFKTEGDKIYAALTLGGEISELTKTLFDAGEAVKGLIVNAIADEYLFSADGVMAQEIKEECAKMGMGIKARLSAPDDFPLTEQKIILSKAGACGIDLTDAFVLSPVKSMAYVLQLTDDSRIFNAQHDCVRCKAQNCPRRAREYSKSDVVANYAYQKVNTKKNLVAVDIGTTTLVIENIKTGNIYKAINPQRRFGADVLSRIEAANRGRGGEMTSAIRFALKKGIDKVKGDMEADGIVIAANTAMVHLLMGYDCASLGVYPFESEHSDTIKTELFGADTTILGGIGAYVGGDIVSGLYMTDFDLSEEINIFVDLGTNGEMAIGNRYKIIATSTAAGPAFEGGRISCNLKGTDVVSLTAKILDANVIDKSGKLSDKYFDFGYRFSEENTITQKDIREIQMAKAAVRSGIECLMDVYGVGYDKIGTVFLSGGMGYYLSPLDAVKIGLLPKELNKKIVAVGNSSLGGAVKYALEGNSERIDKIRKISKIFPLAKHRDFERLYIENMNF